MPHISKNLTRVAQKGGIAALGLAGLVTAASAIVPASGAWFSDTKTGTVTATVGGFALNIDGDGTFDTVFNGLAPGVAQMKTYVFTNSSSVTADANMHVGPSTIANGTSVNPQLLHYNISDDTSSYGLDADGGDADLGAIGAGQSISVRIEAILNTESGNEWQGVTITSPMSVTLEQTN